MIWNLNVEFLLGVLQDFGISNFSCKLAESKCCLEPAISSGKIALFAACILLQGFTGNQSCISFPIVLLFHTVTLEISTVWCL